MLPIQQSYSELLTQLTTHPLCLLQAPPGAGKSTWLPLQLLRDGHFKRIVMLEPRRLAARNIASYLAAQQNEQVGQSVGLRLRQETKVSAQTKLEIVTEGVLTRMLQSDPELTGVDLVIFDEFHERSMAADTALAFALESQLLRDDLRILIMSATLDEQRYQAFFDCPIVQSHGRSFPIEEVYQPLPNQDAWLDAMVPLINKAFAEQSGNILVFLPGQREINRVAQSLNFDEQAVQVHTLYGEQDKQAQQAAIAPPPKGMRKIVLTTNVAETSLTIEGIRVVVDSGKRRAAQFNLNTGVTELATVNISRASATQRAGRAGRLEPGVVYRLGTKEQLERRCAHEAPEILTSDIAPLLLEAKLWGASIEQLQLLDKPSQAQQRQAHSLLHMLELIDEQHKLTPQASIMHSMGTDLRYAHLLHKAMQLDTEHAGILQLAAAFVALMEARISKEPQLCSALNAQLYKPHPAFKQQYRYWQSKLKLTPRDELPMSLLPIVVALAFPDRIAKRRGQGMLMSNGAGVDASKELWLDDELIAIAEVGGQGGKRIFSATAVEPAVLERYLPHLFYQQQVCDFHEKSAKFINEVRYKLGAITLRTVPSSTPIDAQMKSQAWLSLVQKHGWSLFKHTPSEQLRTRILLAGKLLGESFNYTCEDSLLADADTWLMPYLMHVDSVNALQNLDYRQALLAMLDYSAQQLLDEHLPTKITVPSGCAHKVEYQLQGPAKLSVRMQEVYGLTQSPPLARGKLPLLMELLSPAQRPLQLTQDLAQFWSGSYREVQKEMKGRYPKHFWPDDPAMAQATTRVKSKM
ncbi:ATP-dependent helicase HrpB [Pseudoalteromonas sp. SSDWG2]|uniref:ATP-dependent helicase HrpB n=1 Tax=Pseudoalteromonas sp. SSDWG2 TaxID=3139391 RepID=UPI003BAD74CC